MLSRVVVLNQGDSDPRGQLVNDWRHLFLSQLRGWVDRDATKHPTVYCTARNGELPAPNVRSTGVEKS